MKDPKDLRAHQSLSILETLRVIENGSEQIALIVSDDGTFIGTVTDGDIRRALLRGVSLQEPTLAVANRQCVAVGTDTSAREVFDLMVAKRKGAVPVVDADRKLVGVHTLNGFLKSEERPNWAVIAAGGKGTRLRPYTSHLPKPMLPIGDRPLLERIVLHLVSHGIRRIFLSVNYLARMVEDHFGDGSELGCSIEYLHETTPLGTGGALRLLPEVPTAPVLAMNGDVLTSLHIGRMLEFHEAGNYDATIAARSYEVQVPFGVLDIDDSKVTGISEKPRFDMPINAGIYVIEPSIIAGIPAEGELPITNLFSDALAAGKTIGAYDIQEDWADIGEPGSYFGHQPRGIKNED